MFTGAIEILPDRLATIAVLPLQLHLVCQIGQRHGQKLDVNQVKDLAATLGLGVAAQGMESVVLKIAGGIAGGLLGGLIGGATRIATGAVITFAATYALGHVADQYYRQGRSLSAADLRALFERFQQDARTIYPRVEQQIRAQSSTLNLQSVLQGLRANRQLRAQPRRTKDGAQQRRTGPEDKRGRFGIRSERCVLGAARLSVLTGRFPRRTTGRWLEGDQE